YFRQDDQTGSCYRLLVLSIKPATSKAKAKAAIGIVWAMLEELKQGVVDRLSPRAHRSRHAPGSPGRVPLRKRCEIRGLQECSAAPFDQPLLSASHIQRANLNRHGGGIRDDDNRIFRQGYEFVEPLGSGQLRVGLNFVSFQRNLIHLTNILRTPGWL